MGKEDRIDLANLTPEDITRLRALLGAPSIGVSDLAAALKSALAPPDLQEMTKSMFSIEAIAKAQAEAGTVIKPIRVVCQHPTGYKYTAVVVPSKTFKGGRVVSIEDEEAPPIEWPANGSYHDEKGELNIHGKHYIWEMFRQPLYREVIGKELQWSHRLDMKHHYDKIKSEFEAKAEALNAEMAAKMTLAEAEHPAI
jgi:hypothetical protein